MRFGANLHLTDAQLTRTKILESIAFRHASVINDIYSWDREWRVSQMNATDGAQPFSAVYIIAKERGLPFPACKELLWNYCRELEILFKDTRGEFERDGHNELKPEFRTYLQGLEYFMSGIESWSQWTPRYRQ
jgi:aristolochene synthase